MRMRAVDFVWDGEHMVPDARYLPLCHKQFVAGEIYPMVPVENRSMKSHSHYFASINSAWENLPEDIAKKYPTTESLRAKALVETGFCSELDYVCDTPTKTAYLAKVIRKYSEYSVIKISENVVKVFEPKSQSLASMSAEEFKASKEAVLDWIQALNPNLPLTEIKKEASKVAPQRREEY